MDSLVCSRHALKVADARNGFSRIALRCAPCVLCIAFGAGSAAGADSIASRVPSSHPLGADAHFGTSSAPFGAFGASIDWTPVRGVALEAGGGAADASHVRGASMARLRASADVFAVSFGTGFSVGGLGFDPNACGASGAFPLPAACLASWRSGAASFRAAWLWHSEFGFEWRTRAGFHARTALGAAHLLNPDDYQCLQPPCGSGIDRFRATFDLALGAYF